ncbi:MAG: hypothetical protein WC835_01980 [Candidatus Paceibacterota bacterium]|jgi:hypothetical protein
MNTQESFEGEIQGEEEARSIAENGRYEGIIGELLSKGLLEGCVKRTQAEFSARIEASGFAPASKDWEMLTVMRLFHHDTAEHCVRTFEILSYKIHETLIGPSGTPVNLSDNIVAEGVSIPEFLRAALLHDVGKIVIPRSVLDNPISNTKWWDILGAEVHLSGHEAEAVRAHISELSGSPFNLATYREDLSARGVRPIQVCPVGAVLSMDELDDLAKRGFSAESTISEIMTAHEEESRRILETHGLLAEAKLAGMHHNYSRKPLGGEILSVGALQVGADVVGISMADIIHLADVTDALLNPRSYKKEGVPLPKVLSVLVEHANSGKVSREMTYMWIKSELAKSGISEAYKAGFADDLRAIDSFLHGEEVEAKGKIMRRAA